jgi:hypothetical protein
MTIGYPQEIYRTLNPGTKSTSIVDMAVASAIIRAKSNCYLKKGIVIRRLRPKTEAEVLQPFIIQLTLVEDGYIATSDISNIYELEATVGDAVRSYLYSLVDELIWLQKHKENLSGSILEELNQIQDYLKIN